MPGALQLLHASVLVEDAKLPAEREQLELRDVLNARAARALVVLRQVRPRGHSEDTVEVVVDDIVNIRVFCLQAVLVKVNAPLGVVWNDVLCPLRMVVIHPRRVRQAVLDLRHGHHNHALA